jgi:hypothetical protein
MLSLAVFLELSARRKRGSAQQPWKDHVPIVSEIEGLVTAGLVEDVVFEVVVLLEVVELVVLVVVAREVVVEIDDDEVEDVVDVAREVLVDEEADERPGATAT